MEIINVQKFKILLRAFINEQIGANSASADDGIGTILGINGNGQRKLTTKEQLATLDLLRNGENVKQPKPSVATTSNNSTKKAAKRKYPG